MMKKIALVADVRNWAFDIAANIIKRALSNKYQIDIYYSKSEEFNKDLFKILEQLKDYDLIHFFWRAILLDFEKEEFKQKVVEKYGNYEGYIKRIVSKISTGVYDHLYEEDIDFNSKFTKYCNSYVVSSKKLFDIYSNLGDIKKPTAIIGDSFEREKFFPSNMKRFDFERENDERLVIGWVGNSAWNEKQKDSNGNTIDFKGFHTVLKPVVEELQNEGYNIEMKCADKAVKQIENDDMCEYYSHIHIYICVSYKEGTPKPLLEAMGCAVPVITTDVGVAEDALGPEQKQYILSQRKIGENEEQIRQQLKEKIKYLYCNRNELRKLSEENYEFSKKYEIESMKRKYETYFETFLENSRDEGR